MIKIIYCIRRKPHLTREEFQERWLHGHGTLVLERAKAIGMIRYAQSHTVDTRLGAGCIEARQTAEPFDGVMEGWWESDDAAMSAFGSEGGIKAMETLLADEAEIMDFPRCVIFTTTERVWECGK